MAGSRYRTPTTARLCRFGAAGLLALVLVGCGRRTSADAAKPADPVAVLAQAARQAAAGDYRAEYDTSVTTTINEHTRTDQWRQVVMQSGSRRKVETYARGIVLVQTLLQNAQGCFVCEHLADPNKPQCLRMAPAGCASSAMPLDGLRYGLEHGLVTLQMADGTVRLEDRERPCHRVDYTMHAERLTPEALRGLLQTVAPGQPSPTITPETDPRVQRVTGSFCLDAEFGLPLASTSGMAYQWRQTAHPVDGSVQATQTITWLVRDPPWRDDEFALPAAADVAP